jgi:hypothetical protein
MWLRSRAPAWPTRSAPGRAPPGLGNLGGHVLRVHLRHDHGGRRRPAGRPRGRPGPQRHQPRPGPGRVHRPEESDVRPTLHSGGGPWPSRHGGGRQQRDRRALQRRAGRSRAGRQPDDRRARVHPLRERLRIGPARGRRGTPGVVATFGGVVVHPARRNGRQPRPVPGHPQSVLRPGPPGRQRGAGGTTPADGDATQVGPHRDRDGAATGHRARPPHLAQPGRGRTPAPRRVHRAVGPPVGRGEPVVRPGPARSPSSSSASASRSTWSPWPPKRPSPSRRAPPPSRCRCSPRHRFPSRSSCP